MPKQPAEIALATLATRALARVNAMREREYTRLAVTFVLTSPALRHPSQFAPVGVSADWYRNRNGQACIAASLLKACIVEGAIATGGTVTKKQMKCELRVLGHACPVVLPQGEKVQVDMAAVRVGGTPDVRSRALLPTGSSFEAVLEFPRTLTVDTLMLVLACAGQHFGLCDWRPARGGEHGMFEVRDPRVDQKTVDRVLKACWVPELWPPGPCAISL